ncbi:MAG: carboxypeptidase-like regulatory domain-containing protein, partial [Acidobacteria bacterium]|nr:carboxypeptidase-like regulatory domain-containing protein [Acidobacteriota bacterium]
MRVNATVVGAYLLVAACAVGAVRAQVSVLPGQARDGQVAPVAQATGTGVLAGRVTMAGTGQPVGDVRVTLSGAELRGSRSVLTDDDGYYAFTELPAGTLTVRGALTGYVAGTFGQKAPGKPGTAIVLRDGQQHKDASFEIARGGVITGIVLDEKNRPSIGTPVRVMRWMMQAGERMLVNTGTGTTDDRGIYRVYNLMPGEYLVSAVPRNVTGTVMTQTEIAAADRWV